MPDHDYGVLPYDQAHLRSCSSPTTKTFESGTTLNGSRQVQSWSEQGHLHQHLFAIACGDPVYVAGNFR